MFDPKELLFTVRERDDRKVILHYGPFMVEVCDQPEDFEQFVDRLNIELDKIKKEIKAEYID